jgi:hypothetical protein
VHSADRKDVIAAFERFKAATGYDGRIDQYPGGTWILCWSLYNACGGIDDHEIGAYGHREMVNAIEAFLAGWSAALAVRTDPRFKRGPVFFDTRGEAPSKRKEGVS